MEGRTDRIFFVLDGAEEEYAKCKEHNVVMYDTSFGTNSFGMPLGCFTTVSETGQTVILAVSLLRSEKEYMFQWAFEKFHEAFRVRPGSFFTDGDLSMIKALKNLCAPGGIWEGTLHFYCVFHLWKNMYKNVSPLFVGLKEKWREVATEFWRITKDSDERRIMEFQNEWKALMKLVDESASKGANVKAGLAWLEKWGGMAEQWAARQAKRQRRVARLQAPR